MCYLLTKGVFLIMYNYCVGGLGPQVSHFVKHLVLCCICLSHCALKFEHKETNMLIDNCFFVITHYTLTLLANLLII